jgi:hypothetical protein
VPGKKGALRVRPKTYLLILIPAKGISYFSIFVIPIPFVRAALLVVGLSFGLAAGPL